MTETKPESGSRAKSHKLDDPSTLFRDWAYAVREHQYATFGVRFQQFYKNRVPYFSWAQAQPPTLAFIVGDVFYLTPDETQFLQVAADWDAFRLEVHTGIVSANLPRKAFLAHPSELARWLETGDRPETCRELNVSESQAGLLQWQLLEKNEPSQM